MVIDKRVVRAVVTIITAVELVEELCLNGCEIKSIRCDIVLNTFRNALTEIGYKEKRGRGRFISSGLRAM
jgi:hypothetical protein